MNKQEAYKHLEKMLLGELIDADFVEHYEVFVNDGFGEKKMGRFDKTPKGYDEARYFATRYSTVKKFANESIDCVIRYRQYDFNETLVTEQDMARYERGEKVFEDESVPPTFDEWFDSPEIVKEGEEWADLIERTNAFDDYRKYLDTLE